MMLANTNTVQLRRKPVEHRTEPRILVLMEGKPADNAKLKPTVFLPSPLLRHFRMKEA